MPTSTITYNGYTFPYTRLKVYQSPVWAADGVTVEGTAYRFEVTGWLVAGNLIDIRAAMMQMRGKLSYPGMGFKVQWSEGGVSSTQYSFDGSANDGTGAVGADCTRGDVQRGPKPGALIFDEIIGGVAVQYTWSVTCTAKEAWNEGSTALQAPRNPPFLSLVQTINHAVDVNGLTTRSINGTLTITGKRPNSGGQAISADSYRAVITPALPANFRRVNQSFVQSEDGLRLTFLFVDREEVWTLPDPITSGEATFQIEQTDGTITAISDGAAAFAYAFYTLSGWFEAPRTVPKITIVDRIFKLFRAKMPVDSGDAFILLRHTIQESVYGNRIDFAFSATGPYEELPGVGGNPQVGLKYLAKAPPDSNGQAHMTMPYGGDAQGGSGVVASKWQAYDMGTAVLSFLPGQGVIAGVPARSAGATDAAAQAAAGGPNSGISADHRKAPYVVYRETISYEVDNGYVVLDPKLSGGVPLVQRAHMPAVYVIQAGYASRLGKTAAEGPQPGDPFFTKDNGVMLQCSVQAENPQPVAGGTWNRYALSWRYVMRSRKALAAADGKDGFGKLEAQYPPDPRRPAGAATSLKIELDINGVPLIPSL